MTNVGLKSKVPAEMVREGKRREINAVVRAGPSRWPMGRARTWATWPGSGGVLQYGHAERRLRPGEEVDGEPSEPDLLASAGRTQTSRAAQTSSSLSLEQLVDRRHARRALQAPVEVLDAH